VQPRSVVSVFLLDKGVEAESLDSGKFDVNGQMHSISDAGGSILACGTCLKIRQSEGSDICPVSTMHDLHALIQDSDKILFFLGIYSWIESNIGSRYTSPKHLIM